MEILQAKNLIKKFGKFVAVDDISFNLKKGEILGFLGPNGAGKTTTIQILLGILAQTSGEVSYFGKSLKKHREEIMEQVNFSSTYTNLPWTLTVKECLHFLSYLFNIKNRKKKIEEIIERFHLKQVLKNTIGELSAGQLTRLNLAKAFINEPKILLLDEPTASLDPEIARYIRDLLLEEKKQNDISIIFTSHNMAEVEELCHRVIFIDQGKIIANDTPENLARSIQTCHLELLVKDMNKITNFCSKNNLKYKSESRFIRIDIQEKFIPEFLKKIADEEISYSEISIEKPTLEDYFIQVAKKKYQETL